MTKRKPADQKKKVGRITKYNSELAHKLANLLSYKSIDDSCKEVGIDTQSYYNWLYKFPEFFELSTKARKTKAIQHFNACEKILEEVAANPNNPDTRTDIMRLRLDFHLRLAGKANQGLFGDKAQLSDDGETNKPVLMTVNLSKD